MLDLIDAVRDLIEPPADPPVAREYKGVTFDRGESGTWRDLSAAEPFGYVGYPDTLFLFEWGPDIRGLAGASPQDLERFALQAVYVADAKDEEPQERRRRDVTETLDAKREFYAARIRQRRSAASWSHLECTIDGDYVRAFEVRGVALRISGWRVVPAAMGGA